MRLSIRPNGILRPLALLFVLASAAILVSSPDSGLTPADKAYYADRHTIDFVRPGLDLRILGVTIDNAGLIKVRFRITDPKGLPLDREGVTSPGPVSVSFVAATIPKGEKQFVSYTTRIQTSPITGKSATQAAADSG